MKANARIEKGENGLKVAQRANACVSVTAKGVVIKASKLSFEKLCSSVFCSESLLAA